MSDKILECVPNFSEGRRKDVVDEIVAAIECADVKVLDVQLDQDHNRSVVTFVGEPEAVLQGAVAGAVKAADVIDMTKHAGEHPRIGATDVIPLVPIRGMDIDECVVLAKKVCQRLADELGLPTYLYGDAALRADRKKLPAVRKGEFEGLKDRIDTEEGRPDYGPDRLHPTAGATAVGVRKPLIAYNVNLRTDDLAIAKAIAKAIRESSGGLKNVRAIGLPVTELGMVQVSMNLVDYEKTPIPRVFEFIAREANRYGVSIAESEIVGLVPQRALIDAACYYLQLDRFADKQVLESHLME